MHYLFKSEQYWLCHTFLRYVLCNYELWLRITKGAYIAYMPGGLENFKMLYWFPTFELFYLQKAHTSVSQLNFSYLLYMNIYINIWFINRHKSSLIYTFSSICFKCPTLKKQSFCQMRIKIPSLNCNIPGHNGISTTHFILMSYSFSYYSQLEILLSLTPS